jgi:DNA-binding Lrp family transcriptional regulator
MKTVIEMAEEVGAYIAELPLENAVLFEVDSLSGRSAKLEAFAELVTEQANARANTSWALMCKKMVADEREACAKLCDDIATDDGFEGGYANGCAVAIRVRGQA